MKGFLKKILCVSLISFFLLEIENVKAIVPYYYLPTKKNLQKESLSIAKNAIQLLYFGRYEDSLSLAKLAAGINPTNEKIWLIFSSFVGKFDRSRLKSVLRILKRSFLSVTCIRHSNRK